MKVTRDAEKKGPLFGANTQTLVALVRASPHGIIAIDLDGTILLWNRAAEEITGWREEEVLGLPIRLFEQENWESYEVLRRHARGLPLLAHGRYEKRWPANRHQLLLRSRL